MAEEKLDLVSREQALRVARMLGCQGAHEHPNGWMPCGSHEEYEAIKKGKEEYLKVLAAKKKKPLPKMVQRTKRLETKSDAYYENRADAVAISKARGCGGVRTVLLAGKKYYAVCNHKAPKQGWEKLDEKPITGIATLPGGGLVSGSFSGKSLEEKGFVNFVSRSTDPDTFSDPESARIRARNLGCIGIRRYTARDGKLVWLPCTNVSDYNRVTGIRGDNSPRNNPRRQGSKFRKKVLGTPIGSRSNEDGDGDGFTTGGIVGGEDKIPVAPKTVKKVFGFIGKLKHKLGADGSIHPMALRHEIDHELDSLMKDKHAGGAEFAKKMVAKNLASAMSDVTATEVADTILDLMPNKREDDDGEIEDFLHTVKEQMNLVKKISSSSEPLSFVVTKKGDIVPDAFSPAQENAWVDRKIDIIRKEVGDSKMNEVVDNRTNETYEQFERKQNRKLYQELLRTSTQYTHPSPESKQALKEAGLKVLVASWAISSNDGNLLSLAIQDVAQKMFKIDWAVGWNDNKATKNFYASTEFADNKVLKSFVRAQYDATQEYLASKGIKKVTLYRGMQDIITEDYGDGSEVKTVEVLLRPLSAWSTDAKEAETFAGLGYGRKGVVIKAAIQAQDIFSIPLTGVGCLGEKEVVLKSGAVDGILRQPIQYPITDEKKKEFLQWAYEEQTGEPPSWFKIA